MLIIIIIIIINKTRYFYFEKNLLDDISREKLQNIGGVTKNKLCNFTYLQVIIVY